MDWKEILGVTAPILVAILVWALNEHSKRA